MSVASSFAVGQVRPPCASTIERQIDRSIPIPDSLEEWFKWAYPLWFKYDGRVLDAGTIVTDLNQGLFSLPGAVN
jgi:hypothetical protein